MGNNSSMRVKTQKTGAFLSAEVMPNIGVFIGWGLLAALFIPKGWIPNKTLGDMVAPTMKYLMPLLIGYTGGYNVYGQRGGVIGAFATMGVILGADINMLAGAMFMGPVAAWCIKKIDKQYDGKIKPGMEMLVTNFSLGIVGVLLMVLGYFAVVPLFQFLLNILEIGVNFLLRKSLLPLLALFVQPAKVLFLNNAVNHGIMIPLGIEQAAKAGKSLLFMIEANNGCVLGIALAFTFFGKGTAKKVAPSAAIINFFGGIGEVVYPFVLSKPIVILGQIAGSMASLFIIQNFGGGTVAPISPGSFFALVAVSPKNSIVVNIISYFAGVIVSMLVAGLILKADKSDKKEEIVVPSNNNTLGSSGFEAKEEAAVAKDSIGMPQNVQRIVFACDAGMGSSVMGESIMKTKLRKAMLEVEVSHTSVANITKNVKSGDLIVTSKPLEDRVKDALLSMKTDIPVFALDDLLDNDAYDKIMTFIK